MPPSSVDINDLLAQMFRKCENFKSFSSFASEILLDFTISNVAKLEELSGLVVFMLFKKFQEKQNSNLKLD